MRWVPRPVVRFASLERHACAYDARRFGHLVMHYRGHVVSLLMTAAGGEAKTQAVGKGSSCDRALD